MPESARARNAVSTRRKRRRNSATFLQKSAEIRPLSRNFGRKCAPRSCAAARTRRNRAAVSRGRPKSSQSCARTAQPWRCMAMAMPAFPHARLRPNATRASVRSNGGLRAREAQQSRALESAHIALAHQAEVESKLRAHCTAMAMVGRSSPLMRHECSGSQSAGEPGCCTQADSTTIATVSRSLGCCTQAADSTTVAMSHAAIALCMPLAGRFGHSAPRCRSRRAPRRARFSAIGAENGRKRSENDRKRRLIVF